jgi:hypothetical protein
MVNGLVNVRHADFRDYGQTPFRAVVFGMHTQSEQYNP